MKRNVDYIIEKGKVRQRFKLKPVFVFIFSALFTVLIISGVQYVEERGKNEKEEQSEIIEGVETVVPDFIELDTVSEGRKLEKVGERTVYLTFDDGPGEHTARLLDVLGKYDVKATFFVTCKGSDDLILREFKEGHTVALHTCSHNYAIYQSAETYFSDLNAISNRVSRITGKEAKLIRFPGGSSNAISARYNKGIMTFLISEVERRGYKYFDWNVSSGDASNNVSTAEVVFSNVINGVDRRGEGSFSVILQHDIKGFSVDAVEGIIQYGLSNGYKFEALTEDSPVTHHRVSN